MEQENFEVVRNLEEGTEVSFRSIGDVDELFGSMAHLHHAEASSIVVHHLLSAFGENLFWQDARSGREIVDGVGIHIDNRRVWFVCFEKVSSKWFRSEI